MSKPKQSAAPITIKEGKTIFDEGGFLKHLRDLLTCNKYYLKRPLKDELSLSLAGQNRLGKLFHAKFASMKGSPYTKDNLHYPWPKSENYALMHGLFLHHPAFAEPFINAINQYYYDPVLKAWRATQDVSYFPKTSDYFARAWPGTRKEARQRANDAFAALRFRVEGDVPAGLKPTVLNGYGSYFGKRWQAYNGCLLPNGYIPGSKTYGRLKSVPPSTLANANKKAKIAILSSIKALHGVSFFELDLVSCHAKIFENLFDWTGFNRSDLPPLDNLWPKMIADFWEKADLVPGFDDIKQHIRAWPDGYLKGLIKNQYYKSLNGGMATFVEDNVDRSKLKLGISSRQQAAFCEFLHLTFSEMKVFILQTAFIDQVNDGSLLFLPNLVEGFDTSTPSKAQLRKMADPDYTPRCLTGNSRLFSNVELSLIMHVYAAICYTGVNWLVVAYESDGVLIACDRDYDTVMRELGLVNAAFKESIKTLTTAEHELDIKNFV